MLEYQAGVLLNLSQDAPRQATVSFIGSLSGSRPPVTDRVLLESAATQARSLEGRPLAMHSSLILPDRWNRGHGSPPHSANRGDRCPLRRSSRDREA
jgi:hypothetical protein